MHSALAIGLVLVFAAGQTAGIPCSTNVQYTIELDCEWTGSRHPVDYPASTAHFSPLCGTVHNKDYTLWTLGGTATAGVKDLAELGDCTKVKSEIEACAAAGRCSNNGYLRWMCQASGGSATVCTFSGTVTASQAHSKVSMMTMLAPSPDWNVGLDAIELCGKDENGNAMWIERYPASGRVDLNAFDAGTDGGTTFTSPNAPLSPHQPMTPFNAKDTSNIFYHPGQKKLFSICKAKIVLVG